MSESISAKFCKEYPSKQTAVDIFSGLWKSSFPDGSGIDAGNEKNFEDARVTWGNSLVGGFSGKSVLELGPYEAYNTWQFSEYGASPITAIEGNSINFLKCLIVKETLNLNANFLFGNILKYLHQTDVTFDICWASGVLYHQVNPLQLLDSIGRVCRTAFIWTHFYDEIIDNNPDSYPHFNPLQVDTITHNGFTARHYARSYLMSTMPTFFSGGSECYANWLRKDNILGYLDKLGFKHIKIRAVDMEHKAGPCMSLLATKDGSF